MIHSFLRDAGYVYARVIVVGLGSWSLILPQAFFLSKVSHLSRGDRVKKKIESTESSFAVSQRIIK